MKPLDLHDNSCRKTLRLMDSYLSNELLVETNHEVLRHLEKCPECAGELATRTRVRSRLREAVRAQTAPPDLRVHIRQQVQRRAARGTFDALWTRWAVAVAASAAMAAGVLWVNRPNSLPALADRNGQAAYIERVSETVAQVLRVGLGDHLHCSVFRHYPKDPPALPEMERTLGKEYAGLLTIVAQKVPAEYRVVMGHQCEFAGRRYVHLTMRHGGHLLSLVITRKRPGESLAGLKVTESPGGVQVHQSTAHPYEVAGFETPEYLAFVISDLPGNTNLQIAANLAPAVHAFLRKAA